MTYFLIHHLNSFHLIHRIFFCHPRMRGSTSNLIHKDFQLPSVSTSQCEFQSHISQQIWIGYSRSPPIFPFPFLWCVDFLSPLLATLWRDRYIMVYPRTNEVEQFRFTSFHLNSDVHVRHRWNETESPRTFKITLNFTSNVIWEFKNRRSPSVYLTIYLWVGM